MRRHLVIELSQTVSGAACCFGAISAMHFWMPLIDSRWRRGALVLVACLLVVAVPILVGWSLGALWRPRPTPPEGE